MEVKQLQELYSERSRFPRLKFLVLTQFSESPLAFPGRKEYEEFCQWIREQGRELDYLDLDNQLSEYLRVKYFEGKPRSFAVSVVKAVKFAAGSKKH